MARTARKPAKSVSASNDASGKAAQPANVVSLMVSLSDGVGNVLVDKVAERFHMSKSQVAETAGLNLSAIHKPGRLRSAKIQMRMREMLEIISRVSAWAGGRDQAMAWYRAEPLPAFGGRTAESLVKDGKAAVVRDYLDALAMGGFA
jgi:Protein of unknown function (DUF2384)